MCAHVLVLNPDGLPLSIMPMSTLTWQDAITAVYNDHVDVLHTYETWEVHSPSKTFAVPSVVMKRSFVSIGRNVKFTKGNVYLRDQFQCSYCSDRFDPRELTWDHVVPRAEGGKTTWTNMTTACEDCNFEKGHGSRMKPRVMPYKPDYFELVEKKKSEVLEIPDPSWNFYLMWPEERLKIVKRAA